MRKRTDRILIITRPIQNTAELALYILQQFEEILPIKKEVSP
jgi:hypothetical protein